jgi:integrase/recombinase XerC
MSNELVPTPKAPLPARDFEQDVVRLFLEGRNANTVAAYTFDLTDFARSIKAAGPAAAVELLLAVGHGGANAMAMTYRADLVNRGLAAATINRRLAALRSMVRVARQLGRVPWALDVEGAKVKPYRDTRGPTKSEREKLLSALRRRAADTDVGKRDLALFMLMDNPQLRRAECIALDLADVRLGECQVNVIGKGSTEGEWLSIPRQTRDALANWIAVRRPEHGPLFIRLDPGKFDTLDRLTLGSVNRLMDRLSAKAGLQRKARPHGLRHAGITRALDVSGGDVRAVQRLSRHAKLETLMRYDDNRRDGAGKLAQRLADDDDQADDDGRASA